MIWWRDIKGVKDKVKQARRAKRDMVGIVDMMVVDQNAGGTVRNTSAPVMTVCTWAGAAFVR